MENVEYYLLVDGVSDADIMDIHGDDYIECECVQFEVDHRPIWTKEPKEKE